MGELGGRPLCTFDPASGELYASVSSDNRLRLWNTASGDLRQQYVEPRHLAKQYTCIAWHRPANKSKRGSSGVSKPSSLGMIALGTDKGTVSVWDLKRGALAHSLGEGEGLPGVTSVAFSSDGSSLFAASSGKEVLEWNVETGNVARRLKGFKHGATQICLHPAGKILAIASSSIRLVDLTTGKTVRKLSAGHAGSVRYLSFSADGRYLSSSASSARFVNVFDVAASDDPPLEPVRTLGFASTPLFLSLHASSSSSNDGDHITVVAGFDTGGVSVLRTRRGEDGTAVSKLDIKGAAGSPSSSTPSALHARLSSERPSSALLLAMGSPSSPRFTEALFEDAAGVLLSSLSIAASAGQRVGEGEEEKGGKGALAHVVGPGELGIRGSEKDAAVAGEESAGAEDGDGEKEDADGRVTKRLKAADEEEEEAGMTIAERLEALSAAIDEEAERANAGRAGGALVLAAAGARGGEEGAVQPRAESLSTVLTQALQSGDEALLEQCLSVGDQGVIEATVERLPSSKVLQFLLRVVAKLEKRPNRASALGRWIRALLSCHLGYLVSVPGLPDKLALLHQLIDRRVASFPKLLQLHGRLDLLLARAKAEKGSRRGGVGDRAMDRPQSVYKEEEEEEEGEEDSEEDSDGCGDEEGSGDEEEDMDQEEEEGEE